MSDQTMIDTLMATVRTQLRTPDLAYDAALPLRALPGYDSVIAIQIVLGLEKAFAIELDEEEIETMATLGDVLAILHAHKVDVSWSPHSSSASIETGC